MKEQPYISKSVYEIATPSAAVKPSQQSKPVDKTQSLWNKILSDVAKRDVQKDATILMLGDKGAGKRALISAVNQKHVLGRNRTMPVD